MAIEFPNSPSDGQVYFDSTSGIRYVYDAAAGVWLARSNGFYSTVETGQVIFDDNDVTGGSNGLYFSTSANTLYANSINVSSDMRVRGNLYIGTNTVTITDTAVMAQTLFVMNAAGHMTAVASGTTSNLAFNVANAAFAKANASGGYYQGNNGDVGQASGLGDIFRVHSNTLTQNITIFSGNNAVAAGPIIVENGRIITIQTGARMVIV